MTKQTIQAIGFDLFGVMVSADAAQDAQMRQLVINLKNSGYQVGLLSNVAARAYLSDYEPILALFKPVMLSGAIGAAKPHPGAYQALTQAFGVPVESVVYIDDWPIRVEGAVAAGLHGVLFQDYQQLVADLQRLGVKI